MFGISDSIFLVPYELRCRTNIFFHRSLQNADGGRVHITWERVEELEEYIKKLQSAADKLTTENRILRKHHSTICDKVIVTLTASGFLAEILA